MIMLFLLVPSLVETLCTCNLPAPPHSAHRLQHSSTILFAVAIDLSLSVLLSCECGGGGWRCDRAFRLGSTWSNACAGALYTPARLSFFPARAGHRVRPCIRFAAPLHRPSPAETAALRRWLSEREEERLACRRQDISSYWACRRCAHFLQLFPAVSCSERSAGVELAPPSIIILPSPATQPPSADNRTSPVSLQPSLSPLTLALVIP